MKHIHFSEIGDDELKELYTSLWPGTVEEDENLVVVRRFKDYVEIEGISLDEDADNAKISIDDRMCVTIDGVFNPKVLWEWAKKHLKA